MASSVISYNVCARATTGLSTTNSSSRASCLKPVSKAAHLSSGKALRGAPVTSRSGLAVSTARPARVVVRAAEGEFDPEDIVKTLQEKWDSTEDKGTVALYAGSAVVALWLASTLVSAINAVPLLPKFMELVGLGYTSWFVYRYLLFKSSRQDLLKDVEEIKKKIAGTED